MGTDHVVNISFHDVVVVWYTPPLFDSTIKVNVKWNDIGTYCSTVKLSRI